MSPSLFLQQQHSGTMTKSMEHGALELPPPCPPLIVPISASIFRGRLSSQIDWQVKCEVASISQTLSLVVAMCLTVYVGTGAA